MTAVKRKDLVLILARQLAQKVASPVFIVDDQGTLIYYNERAEQTLGQRFEDTGELSATEWGQKWYPEDPVTGHVPLEELPLAIAVMQRKPAHRPLRITGLDGVKRDIEVTAYPLFSREDRFVGAVAIFWEVNGGR